MKKTFILVLSFISILSIGQSNTRLSIIPEPAAVTLHSGFFQLSNNTTISAPEQKEVQYVTTYLRKKLSLATGYSIAANKASAAPVKLIINSNHDSILGREGYRLSVTSKQILIKANDAAGLFYGAQTFLQLLPKDIESAAPAKTISWNLPCVEITDYPRFEWRGLMFDVSRHFFTKEEVKGFIDNMVKYKFNVLHLHLTDDEGWRIEIKSLPLLTKVGAWNVKKEGYFGTFAPPATDEPRTYGGFYTQEDIRELVQYAKERFVNIMPEIDVPGHSLAAVASYPELSCTPGAESYKVRSGERIMDWSHGAPPIALVDNTLCPANEKVYDFLDKVLTEVSALFPFPYIHMGGDECPKNFWEKSEAIKALMQKEGLKTMPEVQSYFEQRLEKIVESKGKRFMGWDEILEGGIAPNAVVMSWRGVKGGIEAAKMGHEVVMSPSTFAYLDYMQGDVAMEPRIYASLSLQKTYQFDPLPDSVEAKYIKGGQGNLWTEQIYNTRHLQYMLWPRALAVAESVWSPKSKKNWNTFLGKVEKHFERFTEAEIKYAPSIYEPVFRLDSAASGQLRISMTTEASGLDIYYSFDNSFPDRFYPKYTAPLIAPKDAAMLKVVTYRGKEQKGRLITVSIEDLKKRAGFKVSK